MRSCPFLALGFPAPETATFWLVTALSAILSKLKVSPTCKRSVSEDRAGYYACSADFIFRGVNALVIISNDFLIRGAVVGLLADAVKLLVNYIAYSLGYTQVVFLRITAAHMLQQDQLHTPAALLIGAVVDLFAAGGLGIIFLWLINRVFDKKLLVLKGFVFGMLVWLGLFGLLATVLEQKLPQSISGILVTLVAHAVFGIALACFARIVDGNERELID